ncbi:MAG: alpha/beta hydrolase [Alphaproteobacteria bacterium]
MKVFHLLRAMIVMSLLPLSACQKTAPVDPIPPHTILTIDSKIVQEERVITVWTPPEYETSDQAFPVLYMPDGGLKEDFPHIANTLSKLIDAGEIAPLILVGIENTERRRDLTGPSTVTEDLEVAPGTDGAAAFGQFIKDELFPEIEQKYRVTDQRAIVGESLAGLFVMDTFMRRPDMFNIYIAMDPSLWWDNHSLSTNAATTLAAYDQQPRKLWFTASNVGDINQHTKQLAEALDAAAPNGLTWTYDPRPKEKHHTIFRATKEDAFRWALWPL